MFQPDFYITNIPGLQHLKSNHLQFAQQKKNYLEHGKVQSKKKLSQVNDSRILFEHD
jgi:hypothetical protein